jgi:hypothetical protein
MREPTYLRVLALVLMLIAPSFSASAQRGERGRFEDRFPLPNAREEQTRRVPEEQTSPRNTPEGQTPLRTQTLFGGHVYHGAASPSPPATSDSPSPPAKIWISPQ